MKHFSADVAIAGAGFSGSLLAWILARAGRNVVLFDRAAHPRFAIGESSTPLADFLLERIAEQFDLPELRSLARWGTWKRELSELRVGKKRGFAYYRHRPGEPFTESARHERSLLVAASDRDESSDTHWMRSDVDQWLCRHAEKAGATVLERLSEAVCTQAASSDSSTEAWHVRGVLDGKSVRIECPFMIDATTGGELLGSALQLNSHSGRLRTRTGALFGHFRQVGAMSEWLETHGMSTSDDPFDGDASAQHHLLDSGWMWMLRFDEGTTSIGMVQPSDVWPDLQDLDRRLEYWRATVRRYPTIDSLLRSAELVAPATGGHPHLGWIPRISRLWSAAAGNNWAMLPGAAGAVDPLHSTGIAHGLSGILRLGQILLDADVRSVRGDRLERYSEAIVGEVQWVDQIVDCCYTAHRDSFELFAAVCSLYFVAAIHSERHMSDRRSATPDFLLQNDHRLRSVASDCALRLNQLMQTSGPDRARQRADLIDWLRRALDPWNDVGLLDPTLRNRIARSTAPK